MPKTSKARRQRRGGPYLPDRASHPGDGSPARGTGKAPQPRTEHVTQQTTSLQPQHPPAQSPFLSPAVRGPESLIFPAMVALGCWGIVIYFLFLTNEANHILFGGMAVLMALLWTFSFGTRVQKLLQQKSRT
jgi:hypothetical protein